MTTIRASLRSRRSPRAVAVAAVAVASVAAATMTPAAAATSTTTAPSGSVLRFMAYTNEGAPPANLAAAVTTAQTYDLVIAGPSSYTPYLAEMHAANPDLRVLVYVNGTFASRTQGSTYPADWYSYDALGRKITSAGYGNYLMRPNSPGWITNRQAACNAALVKSGYEGCMVDMLGIAPLGAGYASGLPINPATGQVWLPAAWLAATGQVQGAIGNSSGQYVMGNGLGNGGRYWDLASPTSVLLDTGQAGLLESWMRPPPSPIKNYPTELKWKQAVDAVVDAGVKGKSAIAMVKLWGTGTTAEKDAWLRFALASYMLGADGQGYFDSSYAKGDYTAAHKYWGTDLGAPAGPYTRDASGYYVRSFASGLALVNPTKAAITVNLGRPYTMLDGTVTSTLTLAPTSGDLAVG